MFILNMREMFFDRAKIKRAVDRANKAALSAAGAFIRAVARNSMKRSPRPSPPGSPPAVHKGQLKKFLFFGYDRANETVVVGPEGFKGSKAPNVLEFGGRTRRRKFDLRRRKRVPKPVNIRKRPYMGPALAKAAPKFPSLWLGSVHD